MLKADVRERLPLRPTEALGAFYRELTARYPEIDDVPEEALDDCPWSIAFDRSDRHYILAMGTPRRRRCRT